MKKKDSNKVNKKLLLKQKNANIQAETAYQRLLEMDEHIRLNGDSKSIQDSDKLFYFLRTEKDPRLFDI